MIELLTAALADKVILAGKLADAEREIEQLKGPPMSFCRCNEDLLLAAADSLCGWPTSDITWTLLDLLPGMDEAKLTDILQRAFSMWPDITVRHVDRAADARVLVTARSIDGHNGVLAETELPCGSPRQVRMWFDLGETWADAMLFQVAWHEFGHALGISHAPQGSRNVMQPYLDMTIKECGPWDLAEELKRYPKKAAPTPSPAPAPKPSPGGNDMGSFFTNLLMQFLKGWLQKAIDDGTLVKILTDLLAKFTAGQIKTVEHLETAAAEVMAVHAP